MGDGVGLGLGLAVAVGVAVGVGVAFPPPLPPPLPPLPFPFPVGVGVGVGVAVAVAVGVGVAVAVAVGVGEGDCPFPLPFPLPVGVGVAVGVALGVGVELGVAVGVAVGVGVGVAPDPCTDWVIPLAESVRLSSGFCACPSKPCATKKIAAAAAPPIPPSRIRYSVSDRPLSSATNPLKLFLSRLKPMSGAPHLFEWTKSSRSVEPLQVISVNEPRLRNEAMQFCQ